MCEDRWKQNISIIKENFIKLKENSISFVDLEIFSEKMEELRAKCENKLLDWIINCSDQEFSRYMTDIAKVIFGRKTIRIYGRKTIRIPYYG